MFDLVDALFSSYPLSDQTLQIEKAHLRYIDGFDDRFEFRRFSKFAEEMLGIGLPLPKQFIDTCVKQDTEITYLLENRFHNTSPIDSIGKIKIARGRVKNKTALIAELHCESNFPAGNRIPIDPENIKRWFTEAHKCLHIQFETLSTLRLKSLMGKTKEISR